MHRLTGLGGEAMAGRQPPCDSMDTSDAPHARGEANFVAGASLERSRSHRFAQAAPDPGREGRQRFAGVGCRPQRDAIDAVEGARIVALLKKLTSQLFGTRS